MVGRAPRPVSCPDAFADGAHAAPATGRAHAHHPSGRGTAFAPQGSVLADADAPSAPLAASDPDRTADPREACRVYRERPGIGLRVGVVVTAAAYAPLPAAPPLPPIAVGSVFAANVVDASTGFLSADTSLRGGLRVFPLYTPQPVAGWRRTATSSLRVVAGWRHRQPDAVAVRLGGRGSLAVLEIEPDGDALAAFTDRFGLLLDDTVQSRSTRGCHRYWVKLPGDNIRTAHDLVPGATLFASGSWMKLAPAGGSWVLGSQPGRADFEPLPAVLLPVVAETEPNPNIRWF